MDFRADLERRAAQLVGKRLTRVRYDKQIHFEWNEYGPEFDVEIQNLLLDFESNDTWDVTWSNECGHCFGLTLASGPHWFENPDYEASEYFEQLDVSETSGWRALLGACIVEARWTWQPVITYEFPPGTSPFQRAEDVIELNMAEAVPSRFTNVPQELTLCFDSGRQVVICAARYEPEEEKLMDWMDTLLVVHDDATARRFQVGPYSPPPVTRAEG